MEGATAMRDIGQHGTRAGPSCDASRYWNAIDGEWVACFMLRRYDLFLSEEVSPSP